MLSDHMAGGPPLPLDPTGIGFVADPFPIYRWLRSHAPACPLTRGGYLLTRHDDVVTALTCPLLGNAPSRFSALAARNKAKYVSAAMAARLPPFLDMPEHRASRRALVSAFFRTMPGFSTMLESTAEAHLGRIPAHTSMDLLALASEFSCSVMAHLVGLDLPPAKIKSATTAFFHLFAPVTDAVQFAAGNEQLEHARAQVRLCVERRKRNREGDLISHLLTVQDAEPTLTDDHVIDNALLVAADGVENIAGGTASTLRLVLATPAIADGIRIGLVPVDDIVHEALRLETPAQIIPRVAREPHERCGVAISAGMPVFLSLGSANRDPEAFVEPDKFLPDRDRRNVVTFGGGRHRCIGERLAVAQIGALIAGLLRRRAIGVEPSKQISYEPRFGHRWPARMELMLTA